MRMFVRTLLVVLVVTGVWGATAWPRINQVETGRTPEYPDLQPREYRSSQRTVMAAVRQSLAALPRWELVGSGTGPAGAEFHAVHTTRLLRFKDDVFIKISRKAGPARVSIFSRSRVGKWDFGQNARNIRELLADLDVRLR